MYYAARDHNFILCIYYKNFTTIVTVTYNTDCNFWTCSPQTNSQKLVWPFTLKRLKTHVSKHFPSTCGWKRNDRKISKLYSKLHTIATMLLTPRKGNLPSLTRSCPWEGEGGRNEKKEYVQPMHFIEWLSYLPSLLPHLHT
jgi:hypothetical protein